MGDRLSTVNMTTGTPAANFNSGVTLLQIFTQRTAPLTSRFLLNNYPTTVENKPEQTHSVSGTYCWQTPHTHTPTPHPPTPVCTRPDKQSPAGFDPRCCRGFVGFLSVFSWLKIKWVIFFISGLHAASTHQLYPSPALFRKLIWDTLTRGHGTAWPSSVLVHLFCFYKDGSGFLSFFPFFFFFFFYTAKIIIKQPDPTVPGQDNTTETVIKQADPTVPIPYTLWWGSPFWEGRSPQISVCQRRMSQIIFCCFVLLPQNS